MEVKEIVGIDASKLTLDCCIHTRGVQEVFGNTLEVIAQMVTWSLKTSGAAREELLFVFEHTGVHPSPYSVYERSGLVVPCGFGFGDQAFVGCFQGQRR